jgi:2-oxoglutarate dehydrogenase E2 component (dihydrolipoamide succinyltransferase)
MPALPITVPSVGESISEGILARWLKADGESVKAGDPLFELETDKASSVVPASSSGVLKIQAKEGETVAIGSTVATIDPSGSPQAATPAPAPATPKAAVEPAPTPAAPASTVSGDGNRPPSPAVRRLATEEGVDLARVNPSGPGGRVTKGDVLNFLEAKVPGAPQESVPATPAAATSSVGRDARPPTSPAGGRPVSA